MKEIFISYSTIDSSQAETVRNVLEKNGLSCWMAPRDIPGGSNYSKEIPVAIRNCKIFVLILSKNAQGSHWVLKELDAAVNNGKVILPFMLEDCILNDEFNFLLTGAQRYSAYQKTAEAMELLIGRIRGILDASCAPAEEMQPVAAAPTATVILDETKCPSCGSANLKPLPRRILRRGTSEMATMLLIPAMSIACAIAGLFLSAISLLIDLILPFMFIGAIAGGIWGNAISRKIVHRRRLRSRITYRCYGCRSCDKKFRIDTPAN